MKILVINCGSSSLKFQFIETSREQIAAQTDRQLARGLVERIGDSEAAVTYEAAGSATQKFTRPIRDHVQAIEAALECLTQADGPIRHLQEIEGVGHRVVHGGEQFTSSVLIGDEVVEKIAELSELAPLHNPNNLKGYQAARQVLPHAPQVAVFDTAFHRHLPPEAFLYGIPYIHYQRDHLRRYGFHGTSHRYLSYRFAQIRDSTPAAFKLITCHLGSGCSVCAIDRGRSVETSMGFTPLEGLVMGTRSGDIDPGVILHLMSQGGMNVSEVDSLLNDQSGLYGLSGLSNDMRDLLREREKGNTRADLAVRVFCHRVRKYLGAYWAVLGGADAVIFAGGIGENSPEVRAMICASLGAFGLAIDPQRNAEALGVEMKVSAEGSQVEVWVIPTNEELLIARDTLDCILGHPPED
jgi:acetate kinase